MKEYRNRIKRLRTQAKLTQDYMAQRLHIDRSAYSRLETGNTKIDIERVIEIAKIIGVPITEIIDEEYNLVFIFSVTLENNEEKHVQLAKRDFPKDVVSDWDALEYIKRKTGAIDGDILAFSFNDYDTSIERFKD